DPATGMTYRIWNREMEQIFGYTASEAVEQRDWNLFGTRAAALLKKDDDALLADPDSGKTARIYKISGRNGLRTVSIVRVLLYDDLLDSNLVAGVVDDITRESELEDQLRQSQKMEAIGRLAGGVAHDFNNLLQVMMGSAEIGISGTINAEKSFSHILEAGEKAMFLTRQLLSFSRDESFNRRVFEVDHRVGEFIKMVHRIIGENAKLEFISGAPGAKINGDPFQLEQVLMNLLVNAKDAIPHGRDGLIKVETSTSKVSCFAGGEPVECVIISVMDTGEGIPPEILDKIFEPFFTTKAQGKGTGLGLASSYGIVAKHDGIIQVESTPGEGTRFDVCIPVCSESLEKKDEKKSEDAPDRSFVPLKILLAEDEEMVREIAGTILESAGHSVVEAKDGGEAVKLFMENRDFFDLLVFDAIMPVMNGSEAFTMIHAEAPDIPVLFCTGYSRDTLVGAFSDMEKAGVLQKPYAAADLLEAVKSLTQNNL
ncbi:MAG: ATP-binding protein, partial [Candidatus Fermentibacteria bacterium]|nr:ATP-binding protein [Candidatus Fermentibacteria bacterium]